MKTSISPEQIKKYQEDGFLSYPGLLNAEEVATLKEEGRQLREEFAAFRKQFE